MAIAHRTIATGVISALLGASFMLAYQGKDLNDLYIQSKKWHDEIDDLQNENLLLSLKLQQPNHQSIIESIRVDVIAPDQLTQIEVVQIVKEKLAFLKNRPLSSLVENPDIPYELLEGLPISIDKQSLILHVDTVVITPKLYLKVTATPADTH